MYRAMLSQEYVEDGSVSDLNGISSKNSPYTLLNDDRINKILGILEKMSLSTSPSLSFDDKKGFLQWVNTLNYSHSHFKRNRRCFEKYLDGHIFTNPLELLDYLRCIGKDLHNITKVIRNYLTFCELSDKISPDVIDKYRKIIKIPRSQEDYHTPTDVEIREGLLKARKNKSAYLVYLILLCSGIRYVEGLDFLKNYEKYPYKIYDKHICFYINKRRVSKNINNIYLPLSVWEKISRIDNSYHGLRQRLKETGCKITWKYIRKWHHNLMLYNGVPESVADYIQGRSAKTVGGRNYMDRESQPDYWYDKLIDKIEYIIRE